MYCSKLTRQAVVRSDAPVVETKKGRIAGIKKEGAYLFRGIKYADAKRFHMPEETAPWEGIKEAVTYGYVCPEMTTPIPADGFLDPHYYMPQDENCQYLNIWTPSVEKQAKKPVMVWMHGGGWLSGSSVEQCAYDGEELSRFGDVVVVSFNHRHNCLGGLDLSLFGDEYAMSGYCGLGDVIALLEWVNENIEAFGGDRENITVFGQSGGVAKILYAMQCPKADGLFQKAAIDSGGIKEQIVPEGWTKKQLAQRLGQLTAEYLGLTKETIRRIETVPYWDLADAAARAEQQLKKESGMKQGYRYEPVEDGRFVIGSTLQDGFRQETKQIPMLIGNVFGEARSNMLAANRIGDGDKKNWDLDTVRAYCKERFGELAEVLLEEFQSVYPENDPADVLYMDHAERDGQLGLAEQRVRLGADVWNWLFKKESPVLGGIVAWHCSELPFVFHNAAYIESAFEPGVSNYLEDTMAGAWVTFARTGDPNDRDRISGWGKVTDGEVPTMIFDKKCEVKINHDLRLRTLLREAEENRKKAAGSGGDGNQRREKEWAV